MWAYRECRRRCPDRPQALFGGFGGNLRNHGESGAGKSFVARAITGYLPRDQEMERVMRIELTSPAWEAGVIPLYDTRLAFNPAVRSSGASSCRRKQPHHAAVLVFDNVAVVRVLKLVGRRAKGSYLDDDRKVVDAVWSPYTDLGGNHAMLGGRRIIPSHPSGAPSGCSA